MTLQEYVINKIDNLLDGPKKPLSKSYNFRCPFCGDSQKSSTKARGHYYLESNSYYCFNCHKSADIFWFLAKIECKPVEQIKLELLSKKLVSSDSFIRKEQSKIGFSKEWTKLENNAIALQFIKKRKIFEAPFIPPKWQLFYDKKYQKVVIPWLYNGKLTFWQMRALYKHQTPKYLNSDVDKHLFGLDNIDHNFKYVFITEGVFDCIFIKNCVVAGGVSFSDKQMELLKKDCPDHKIIWLLNNQNIDTTSKNMSLKLLEQGHSVFIWPKDISTKDVNDYVCKYNDLKKFADTEFLLNNTFQGAMGIIKLKFI